MNEPSNNGTHPSPHLVELDNRLSEFFKSELPRRWPAAPFPATPSTLAASRSHDTNSRARLTLAASVAILLGGTWYLSTSSRPADRAQPQTVSNPDLFGKGMAKDVSVLPQINQQKAKATHDPLEGFAPETIQLP